MAELKTKPTTADVAAFLAAVTPEARRHDAAALVQLMQEVTGAPPVLWGSSIIGFGSYRYTYDSGRTGDWPLVGFAPRKANLVLYIMPGFTGYDALLARLGKHTTGKSCLYLKRLSDVDPEVLRTLIARSVAQIRARHGA